MNGALKLPMMLTILCGGHLISVVLQYVVEARYTGEEHELAGAAQQQVVGHKERYISGVPINYGNNDLYQ